MEKVILFGAGSAGEKFIRNFNDKDLNAEIIGIVDSDVDKHGRVILGHEVFNPSILEDEGKYDLIIITSQYYREIKDLLKNKYNISEDKVKVSPRNFLYESKQYRVLEDKQVHEIASNKLIQTVQIFNEKNINYFIEFGTLLGIIRDGDILPWDDDIDISVYREDMDKVKRLLKGIYKDTGNIKYEFKEGEYRNGKRGIFQTISKIDINGEIKKFPLDIYPIDFYGDKIFRGMSYIESKFHRRPDYITYKGVKVRTPKPIEGYLERVYGSRWRTPIKDISWDQYRDQPIFK